MPGSLPPLSCRVLLQVVCRVVSVHLDRLEVKVAVRYPKTYGPKTAPSQPEAAEEVNNLIFMEKNCPN